MTFLVRVFGAVFVITLTLYGIWPSSGFSQNALDIAYLGQIRGELSVPTRLDLDDKGNLFVADSRKKAVLIIAPNGVLQGALTSVAPSGGGLAITPDGGTLYLACGSAVAVIDVSTDRVTGWLGAGEGEFASAGFLDLDDSGNIFVADTGTRRVKVYNPQGVLAFQFGPAGGSASSFSSIFSLAVNTYAGEVYVADCLRTRSSPPKIYVFNLAGQLQRTLLPDSTFGDPVRFLGGMTFDNFGRGYFLDILRSEFRVLALPGTFVFRQPHPTVAFGRWVDTVYDPGSQRLFVADDNGRVEIFGIDGGTSPLPATENRAPEAPLPLQPIRGSEVASATPVLAFANALDADGDPLTYNLRVFRAGQLLKEYGGLPEQPTGSSLSLDLPLQENGLYSWMVQAVDGRAASAWSAEQSFYVNAVQEPPAVPVLLAPLGTVTLDREGLLQWQASSDPDPDDSVDYLVQLDLESAAFSHPMEQQLAATRLQLSELPDYRQLQDGQRYAWRVIARDQHGLSSAPSLAGSFTYDTTVLQIRANMPDARVYLGGSHAYPGRFVGTTPLEIRDLPSGSSSVVVERAGFEPFVGRIRLGAGENMDLYVRLVPAIVPDAWAGNEVRSDKRNILLSGNAAPLVVDFDKNDRLDLLTGDDSGAVTLFSDLELGKGRANTAKGRRLDLPLFYSAAPCLVDWDNDGRTDLLVGGGDGTVRLYRNRGSEETPAFDEGSYLQAAGRTIGLNGAVSPAVIDLDRDGSKDLVLGCATGEVLYYRNDADDAAPRLVSARRLLALNEPVAPFFTDWNADGIPDLLLGTPKRFLIFLGQDDGDFAAGVELNIGQNLKEKKIVGCWHPFVMDLDQKQGKDLLVGSAKGTVLALFSKGKTPVAAFWPALQDKLAQIEELGGLGAFPEEMSLNRLAYNLSKQRLKESILELRRLAVTARPAMLPALQELLDILTTVAD